MIYSQNVQCSIYARYYIFLMDVAQNMILIVSISNLTMLIESGILYSKILHHSFISTICENFKYFFFFFFFWLLSSGDENLETCVQVWFEQLKELKQFRGTFTG